MIIIEVSNPGGGDKDERDAVAREIVRHFRMIGITVEVQGTIPVDVAHDAVLSSMREEVPIIIETFQGIRV
jgi:hypothetical protein